MRSSHTVLYLCGPELEVRVRSEIAAAGGRPHGGALQRNWMVLSDGAASFNFLLANDVPQAIGLLVEHYFNFVVIDGRCADRAGARRPCAEDLLPRQFTQQLHYSADPSRLFPRHRIIAVLDEGECLAEEAFQVGQLRIGGFVVNPFPEALLARLRRAANGGDPAKCALCLSGGGVEGLLYELGVLKALNAHLQSRSVTELDIFCGISAGSIVAALLANGTEPEEIAAAALGSRLSSVEPIGPGVLFDPDVQEYISRLWQLTRDAPLRSWQATVSSALRAIPVGFFRGEALRQYLERQLTSRGRTDDFRRLKKELYIGATDQDTSAHVVFGAGQWRDVPISSAVRASCSLVPFFEPQKIRGRYFVDGQYTRTSNFQLAIDRGATLVLVIDPVVPVRVEHPGYVRAKGGMFAWLQGLKAVIHTRFMRAIREAAEAHPELDFVLFKPEGEDMRLLSGSPMKYRLRTEIVNLAYRCAVQKIHRDFEILGGTFAKHGYLLQRYPRLRAAPDEVA